MKTKIILNTLFFALLGAIFASFVSLAPGAGIVGALAMQLMHFVSTPAGVLGVNLGASLKELEEEKGKLARQMTEMVDKAKTEKRDLTTDESTLFDKYDDEYIKVERGIKLLKREEEIRQTQASNFNTNPQGFDDKEKRKLREKEVFYKLLRRGFNDLSAEERDVAYEMQKRAQAAGTGTAGGYLVPEGFAGTLESALKTFGGVREVATVFKTETGNTIPFPTENDTTNKGELVGENADVSEQDITFGVVNVAAYKYSSKWVKVSLELLQDSAFDLESWLPGKLAERIGRITNEHFTTGTGTAQPLGIVTAAVDSGVSAAATGISRANIVDLIHSVNSSYRQQGAMFMFSDSTLRALKKLTVGSGDDRPLWQPSMRDGEPDKIEGYSYIINDSMATLGANNKSIIFGNFKKYLIRDVNQFIIVIAREKFIEKGQIGFLGFSRHDGRLIDAGTNPIKFLKHAAS